MMAELHRELVRRAKLLAKEESGVALMLTLSVFLMLYVACAGVYAIGETVRQKIELQNACDSAAYSAAVVQADGLSRMAMVNRALSWTYVQLTNLQMDYITYRWLRLAKKTFEEDRDACQDWNENPFAKAVKFFTCQLPQCRHEHSEHYVGEGKGWFCGLSEEKKSGMIRINGKAVEFSTLDELVTQFQNNGGEEKWKDTIDAYKSAISNYNAYLPIMNIAMQHSIQATASATLYANLPQEIKDDGSLEIDKKIGKDMLWYVNVHYPGDPYAVWEQTSDSSSSSPDENTPQSGYFSPLFNTEAGERIFLTMADGACYDRLEPYFSNGNSDRMESGGLDQWFIRSDPNESAKNEKEIEPTAYSYSMPGICRVYKNANRKEGGGVLRGHHTSVGALDTPASCVNSRDRFAEQCKTVNESVALCAEYEWASAVYSFACHIEDPHLVAPYEQHDQYSWPLSTFPHNPDWGVLGLESSHSRSNYSTQCYIRLDVFRRYIKPLSQKHKHPRELSYIEGKMMKNPFGFTRIYGDDKKIYERETYTGYPAKPWILNDRFYSTDGAITVGLARKQRNPFLALFDSLADGLKEKDDEVKGIYSAFNPVTNGYITAFSAARAAHRFHPSQQQWSVIQGMRHHPLPDSRDYETRYDSVCHDDMSVEATDKNYDEGTVKLRFDCANDTLRKRHIGCVCENEENYQRFARCWNLWQTDWDATLLPVPYAQADSKGAWFDSYLHDKASSSGGNANEQGNITWQSVEDQVSKGGTPFDVALAEVPWFRFFDEDGNLITDEDRNGSTDENEMWKGSVGGAQFLPMQRPKLMGKEPMTDEELERHFRALLMQRIL